MGLFFQVFSFSIIGIILLIFGYTLFFGPLSPLNKSFFSFLGNKKKTGEYGDPQTCPLCSLKLEKGDLVKSMAFPSLTGGIDRLMYIRGCYSCLNNVTPRRCPVCGCTLSISDYLVSRMFERIDRPNHVHVLGCNLCRKMGSLDR